MMMYELVPNIHVLCLQTFLCPELEVPLTAEDRISTLFKGCFLKT